MRRPIYVLLAFAVVGVVLEFVSFVAAQVLLPTGLLVGEPDTGGYDEYLAERDPLLGWPSPGIFGSAGFDESGSRIVPAFADVGEDSCVALYGDSFTWGDEVEAEHAYGNVLAGLLNCRVANYGVGGYGTDQAVLRYTEVIQDDAPLVVIGHFSDNITRNVNQLRDFIAGGRLGFKPRFVIGDEGPQPVALPTLTEDEYREVASRSAELLPHEYFRPGTWGAAGIMAFPYTKAIAHVAMHQRVLAALRGIRPTYAPFYDPQHPSQALPLTVQILQHAARTAAAREQRLLVLLIPDLHDLEARRAGRPSSYAPLRAELDAAGLGYIDAADYFLASHGARDFCELFVRCGGSHFNPDGYRYLAEAVYAALESP